MLMTALVDPSAFDRKLFDGNYYGSCAKHFLEDMIIENGLLFADRRTGLVKDMMEKINALPSKYGSPIQTYLTTALKSRCRVVGLETSPDSSANMLKRLIQRCPPDAIFTSPERIDCFKEGIPALSFLDYQDSRFQSKRRRYQRGHLDLNQLGDRENEDIFVRTIRFAKKLGIYDKQIGQADEEKIDNFLRGIDYILGLWQKHGYFMNRGVNGQVDIYTCEKRWYRRKHANDRDRLENQQRIDMLRCLLVYPLRETYGNGENGWEVNLHVKQDRWNEMHARYLDAGVAVLHIDRGFDFFDRETFRFKSNPVSFRSPVSINTQESIIKTLHRWQRSHNARIP